MAKSKGKVVTAARAQIFERADGFRFRIKGGNGEVIAVGEAYVDKADAIAAARALIPAGVLIEGVDDPPAIDEPDLEV